jgi:hypothetical protein
MTPFEEEKNENEKSNLEEKKRRKSWNLNKQEKEKINGAQNLPFFQSNF